MPDPIEFLLGYALHEDFECLLQRGGGAGAEGGMVN